MRQIWFATIAVAAVIHLQCGFAAEPVVPLAGPQIEQVDFERHVAPLLSRLGCNAGSCHGASEGKGGFRLSLFGHNKLMDYEAITDDQSGRVDVDEPKASLILEKPSLSLEHEGGLRLPSDSWEYQLISRWVQQGANHRPGSGELTGLAFQPAEIVLDKPRASAPFQVWATYGDGSRADVTALSQLRTNDEAVVTVDAAGRALRVAAGDTSLVATYSGRPTSVTVLAPNTENQLSADDKRAENNIKDNGIVDHFIAKKLDRLHIQAAPLCSDETFLRRVTLSVTGQLPNPEAIRAFIADPSTDKRDRKIDELLNDPLNAAMWATRMCEITGSLDRGDGARDEATLEEDWHTWFRSRFQRNTPYDQIAQEVLCSTSKGDHDIATFIRNNIQIATGKQSSADHYAGPEPLDLFWQRPKVNEEIDIEGITERISAAFLGIRIECARCHKHPFDRWSQNDHRSFANVFSQVRFGMSPELRSGIVDALDEQRQKARDGKPTERIPKMREVYLSTVNRDLRDPMTKEHLPAKPLSGTVISSTGDRRIEFANWLTSQSNPFFARNFVNRVWARYFGRGIVDPVDAFSAGNPPSHPELLDALAEDFIHHGFDVRRLERQILRSHAWQRSTTTNASNRTDQRNYARATVTVLPAEVVIDALACAIGDQESRAVEFPKRRSGDEQLDSYFDVFNRPERKLTCDCEKTNQPTLRQSMLLLADPNLIERIELGHTAWLAGSSASDNEIVEELFLRSLSRLPDEAERKVALKYIESTSPKSQAIADLMWSLINTREFATNH